jgi:4-hydroxybenzoate polyprenyltransferase
MRYFLLSMRPEQWIKNFVVFAGLVFSGNLLRADKVAESAAAFCLFCLLSGVVYILNDICDREYDKKHILKSRRPIAAGKLKVVPAATGAGFIAAAVIPAGFAMNPGFGSLLLAYFAINVLYSLRLKKIIIIDVFVISLGFVLRVIGGILAISVIPTPWIVICTIFLSLFISLCKRRQELVLLRKDAPLHRAALTQYPLPFLNQLINFTAAAAVFSYILFTGLSGKNINLMYSVPFVLYGVVRYLYLIYVKKKIFPPVEMLLRDGPLQFCVLSWVALVVAILYR